MSDDLVARARNGDSQAWDALVERYAPLVWSIFRSHQLDGAEAGRSVWLQLSDQLGQVRDSAALADRLATITQRESGKVRRAQGLAPSLDVDRIPGPPAQQELLLFERHAALREAFGRLPFRCRQLLAMIIEDPPVPDIKICAELGIPADRLGLRRGHCLDRLRSDPAIAALVSAAAAAAGGELSRQAAEPR